MSIGTSGRIVIELDPELKKAVHETLKRKGSNLKAWFVEQAQQLISENNDQLDLGLEADPPTVSRR